MSTTQSQKDGALPWWMLTGMPSALYKGIEGEDWEEMYESYKEMSGAVGVKKPHEAQKAQALWAMKAARDRTGDFL